MNSLIKLENIEKSTIEHIGKGRRLRLAIMNRKEYNRKNRDNLSNSYVIGIITRNIDLIKEDITPEIIETQRLIIQLKRELKTQNNGAKKT
jgi:hypothetical protein